MSGREPPVGPGPTEVGPKSGADGAANGIFHTTRVLAERATDMKTLADGWQEAGSRAPDPATLDRFIPFIESLAAGAPFGQPHIYATLDGGAQAEWTLPGWELSVRLTPGAPTAEIRAVALAGQAIRRAELPVGPRPDAAAPSTIVQFARFVE